MDKGDYIILGMFCLAFGYFFGLVVHTGYYENQIDKELNEIAGDGYIKMFNFQGHRNLNQLYDKDGNCMGIYWIKITLFDYEIREVRNFAQCEAL